MTASGFGGASEGQGTASVDEASNVLLSFPATDDRDRHTCGDLLAVDGPDHRDVILVALSESPDERIDRWRSTVGPTLPDRLHIVTTDDTTRSASAAIPSIGSDATVTIDTVPTPGDLTGLGIAISEHLENRPDPDADVACCFDSLTDLLNDADRQAVFQFLHVLTAQLRSVDATAHFHIDPTAHDGPDIRAVTSLFDTEVTAADDGGIEVRSR